MKKFALICLFLIPSFAGAASGPLFSKGAETFRVLNDKGQTPDFHLLSGSVTKQSLAVVINNSFHFPKTTAAQDFVDFKIEKIILTPEKKNPDALDVTLHVSGQDFDIDPTVSKKELLSGKSMNITMPPKNHDLGMMSVTVRGKLTVHFTTKDNTLWIDQASGQMDINSTLTDEDPEKIQFSGKAVHE